MTRFLFPIWLIYSEPEGLAIETFDSKICLLVYPMEESVNDAIKVFIHAGNRSFRPFEVTDRPYFIALLTALQSIKGLTHVTLNGFNGIHSRIIPLSDIL